MSKITMQIHDYDRYGFYHIVEDRKVTKEEAWEMMTKARESVTIDWDKLPPECTHIVYYAELMDKNREIWFVGIYMHGEAYPDSEFDRVFHREDIGYVGAFHKRV